MKEEDNLVIKSPLLTRACPLALSKLSTCSVFSAHAFLLFLECVTFSSTTGPLHVLFPQQPSSEGAPHSIFPLIRLLLKLLQRGYPSKMISILKTACFLLVVFILWFLFSFLFRTYLCLKLCIALFFICLLSDSQWNINSSRAGQLSICSLL